MHLAASGRPGPVVIGLPEDVLVRPAGQGTVPPRRTAAAQPGAADLDELTNRLSHAERPLLIVGGDGWTAGDGGRLAAWAVSARVPVAADFRSYDAVPHTSAAWAGWLGYGRADTLAARLDQADLLVFVGCARTDVLSDGYTRGTGTPTVLVLPDPDAAGKDFMACLNPGSQEVLTGCKVEASLKEAKAGDSFQFMRLGYFCPDSKDSSADHLVFNRSVGLKDSFKPGK
jgi:thiamine pyrophosphate-dependent acetolactate synthase large subunit-like protein